MVVAQELDLERIALAALAEDVGGGDLTTEATVAEDATCTATLLLKEPGVVCGLPAAEAVFRALDPNLAFEPAAADGDRFQQPAELARITGRTRAVLTGERTALNLLGRLSGIATLTRRFVDAIEGTGWDIGYGALFLASDESRWITGITLPIDGGATAGAKASPVP